MLITKDAEWAQPSPPLKKHIPRKSAHHKTTSSQIHRLSRQCMHLQAPLGGLYHRYPAWYFIRLDLASEETKVLKCKWIIERRKQTVPPHMGETPSEELEGTLKMFSLNFCFYSCGNWGPERETHLSECLTLNILVCLPFFCFPSPPLQTYTDA